MPKPAPAFDPNKVEYTHQLGGIQTGTIDYPQPNGGQSCRVALVNTGGGLTFTVALDRGGDIVEAAYLGQSLAYLTPNGYKPPSHAYHRGEEWLAAWPGGLVTTCGPLHIGAPPEDAGGDDPSRSLHGHFSNTPAAVESIINPDPRAKRFEMRLDLVIRCTRMFGPSVEIRRTIACKLGEPTIELRDRVTNLSDFAVPHHWLYHVNLGYPLLDEGAQLIYGGDYDWHWDTAQPPGDAPRPETFGKFKRVPALIKAHAQNGQRGLIVVPRTTRGQITCGLINRKLGLGFEMSYPAKQLPRLANWQNFGPRGCYVTGLEPFHGSLQWDGGDTHPAAKSKLRPGQTASYDLTFRALGQKSQLDALRQHDAPLTEQGKTRA
ncbi:MAG: DUF4432 family protein [Planctomycetes bacterium]|jgi:hypothetical protein|nr:DUF4432 family protein [Planctomycetota bacterium]